MSRPETVRSFRDRFAIGASLIPPVALLMIANRAGWVPGSPRAFLAGMPVAVGLGMLFPTLFEPWHRGFSRMRSWLGGRLVFLLLLGSVWSCGGATGLPDEPVGQASAGCVAFGIELGPFQRRCIVAGFVLNRLLGSVLSEPRQNPIGC